MNELSIALTFVLSLASFPVFVAIFALYLAKYNGKMYQIKFPYLWKQ